MKWTLDQFLTILKMSEIDRRGEFSESLIQVKNDQKKLEEVRDVIFHFFELASAYCDRRASELREQERQQVSEISRLQ